MLETKLFILVLWKHIAGKVELTNTFHSLMIKKNVSGLGTAKFFFREHLAFLSCPQTSHTIAVMQFGA